MDRRQRQQQQHHWGGDRSLYLLPPPLPQSQSNNLSEIYPNPPDVLALEPLFSNLRVSSDYALRRHHHPTMPVAGSTPGGADVAFGLRSDPVTGYHQVMSLGPQYGNVDVQGLMTMMRRAQSGPHDNPDVDPARSWTVPAGNGGPNLAAAASALPWLRYGEDLLGLGLRNSERYREASLLCKKQFPRTYSPQSPNLQNSNLYQNSVQTADVSVSRNLSFLTPDLNKKDEIQRGDQQCAILNLEELRGKIVSLAKDHNGCRILQDNLIFLDDQGTEVVLSEVIEYIADLMKNQSGSYLIQKLFSVCTEEQKTNIILALTKKPFQLIAICLNPFGARAMQKLLEDLSSPQQRSLVIAALCPGAVTLASDPNGHLVILYCLKNFSFEYNKHLINEIAKNCFGIATNRNGCCVLQSCIENARGEAGESLVNEIIASAVQLSENPYGNYVVQHLLGQNIPGAEENLLEQLEGKFASLACNKYASNVVEKFFVKSGEQSNKIIEELISSPNLPMLLVDPFGNYVIQKALKVAEGEVFNALVDLIMVNAPSMQSNIYGKMILACLSRCKVIPMGK